MVPIFSMSCFFRACSSLYKLVVVAAAVGALCDVGVEGQQSEMEWLNI
jgi:hypothetical protein